MREIWILFTITCSSSSYDHIRYLRALFQDIVNFSYSSHQQPVDQDWTGDIKDKIFAAIIISCRILGCYFSWSVFFHLSLWIEENSSGQIQVNVFEKEDHKGQKGIYLINIYICRSYLEFTNSAKCWYFIMC